MSYGASFMTSFLLESPKASIRMLHSYSNTKLAATTAMPASGSANLKTSTACSYRLLLCCTHAAVLAY